MEIPCKTQFKDKDDMYTVYMYETYRENCELHVCCFCGSQLFILEEERVIDEFSIELIYSLRNTCGSSH